VCKQPVNDLLASNVAARRAQSHIPSLGFLGMSTAAINIIMQQAPVYSSDDTSSCTGEGAQLHVQSKQMNSVKEK
jgi:hypothetical protein